MAILDEYELQNAPYSPIYEDIDNEELDNLEAIEADNKNKSKLEDY